MSLKPSFAHCLILVSTALLGACSSGSQPGTVNNTGYQSSRVQTTLEIPPDLIKGTVTELKRNAIADSTTEILPTIEGIEMLGEGLQRYLKVEAEAARTWEKTLDFVNRKNFPLVVENKREGILETDWIGDDSVDTATRSNMRRIFGSIAGRPPVSDKYKFWLERLDDAKTAIHVEQAHLTKEVIESKRHDENDTFIWQESPGNEFQLVKILRELAAFLSGADTQLEDAAYVLIVQTEPVHLMLAETEGNAWSRVERAIITSPYTLEFQDRENKLFQINEPQNAGFWSKLKPTKKFGIRLEPSNQGKTKTRISITNKKGKATIDSKDALPVLWAIAGELRRAETK